MEIVKKQDIPELPVLSNEKRDLVGLHGLLSNAGLNSLERRARREKRKIFIETEIQLLRDRTSEIIRAYRTNVAAAQEVIKKLAEENVQKAIDLSDKRIGENKTWAMGEAADDFTSFLLNIRPDMPEEVKDILVKNASDVFVRTLEKIKNYKFSIEERIHENYPEKKSFLDKFRR
ncbi:MAG: hypothetical protein ACLP3B_07745 [Syntrophobacteraceae bacterium]